MKEQYLNIPYSILKNPTFSSDEKLILAEIVSLDKLRNGCTASDEHFEVFVNKSRQTINGIVKKFEKKGLLTITKKGKGKKTKLTSEFWNLIKLPAQIDDTIELNPEQVVVEFNDTTCREINISNVEFGGNMSRENDTTITSTITDIQLQESIQYTGAIENVVDKINYENHQDTCNKIIDLICFDRTKINNSFLLQFHESCCNLVCKFEANFFNDCHIFKTNNQLYEIYGFEKFSEIRKDLIFVKENIAKFLRIKNFN